MRSGLYYQKAFAAHGWALFPSMRLLKSSFGFPAILILLVILILSPGTGEGVTLKSKDMKSCVREVLKYHILYGDIENWNDINRANSDIQQCVVGCSWGMGTGQCFGRNYSINFYDWSKIASGFCAKGVSANGQSCRVDKFSKQSHVQDWLASEPLRREKAAAEKKQKKEREKQLTENAVKYAQNICDEERCVLQNALSVWMNKRIYKTKSGLPSKEENNSEKGSCDLKISSIIDIKSMQGDMQSHTKNFVRLWQVQNGHPKQTGYLTEPQIDKLLKQIGMKSDYDNAKVQCVEAEKRKIAEAEQKKIDDLFAEIELGAAKECEAKLSESKRKQIQIALREEVNYSGKISGNLEGSRGAITLWQKENGYRETGYLECDLEKILIVNNTEAIIDYATKQIEAAEKDEEKEVEQITQEPAAQRCEVPNKYSSFQPLIEAEGTDKTVYEFVEVVRSYLDRRQLKQLQRTLKTNPSKSYYGSTIDGLWGKGTRGGVLAWIEDENPKYNSDFVITKADAACLIRDIGIAIDKSEKSQKAAELASAEEVQKKEQKPSITQPTIKTKTKDVVEIAGLPPFAFDRFARRSEMLKRMAELNNFSDTQNMLVYIMAGADPKFLNDNRIQKGSADAIKQLSRALLKIAVQQKEKYFSPKDKGDYDHEEEDWRTVPGCVEGCL
tara:strand:+ start:339 stop:2351 length:2013 start_codon:yes stop_codon:yes gene_type:complete